MPNGFKTLKWHTARLDCRKYTTLVIHDFIAADLRLPGGDRRPHDFGRKAGSAFKGPMHRLLHYLGEVEVVTHNP